jgi:thymidylate kinase
MFIIVEGPKYCGKSTLCTKLQQKFGGEIIHFPTNSKKGAMAMDMLRRPSLTPEEYVRCQDLMSEDIDETLASLDESKMWILDRSFISNAVYRDGEHIIIPDKYLDIIDRSEIIIMDTEWDVIVERIELRTEKKMTAIEQSKLKRSYDRFKSLKTVIHNSRLANSDL